MKKKMDTWILINLQSAEPTVYRCYSNNLFPRGRARPVHVSGHMISAGVLDVLDGDSNWRRDKTPVSTESVSVWKRLSGINVTLKQEQGVGMKEETFSTFQVQTQVNEVASFWFEMIWKIMFLR